MTSKNVFVRAIISVGIALALGSRVSASTIYRCNIGGSIALQDTPCTWQPNKPSSELVCVESLNYYTAKVFTNAASPKDRMCAAKLADEQRLAQKNRAREKTAALERQKVADRSKRLREMEELQKLALAEEEAKRAKDIETAKARGFYVVEYVVFGSADRAFLTYTNATGGTEQHDVNIPWNRRFFARKGDTPYIAAQNKSSDGTIAVLIYLNGEAIKTSESSAEYGIATAGGRI
ncbi:MAG: hypothetical protein AB7N69_13245 [Immundisolibacter sp.]|uniref:hypothetical protein n=1 Tax=Immundisolibacter sp. TaxID=1934948 RepID=UPI003D11ABFA